MTPRPVYARACWQRLSHSSGDVKAWPTLVVTDGRMAGWGKTSQNEGGNRHSGTTLTDAVARVDVRGRYLDAPPRGVSSAWAGRLMGFPPGWLP